MNYQAIDLFAGCGGFSLGFEKSEIQIKYSIDNNKNVKETFEYNHPNTEFILSDIEDLNPEDFKDIDVIIGSPPCQDFSNANAKKDPDKGMELVLEFFRWIKIIKPKFWIMENVPNVQKYLKWRMKNFKIPLIKILNAVNYGVPQTRKRCFSGKYKIPIQTYSKTPGPNLLGEKLKKWINVFRAIKDLMLIPPNQDSEPRDCEVRDAFFKKHGPLDLNKPAKQLTTKEDFALIPRTIIPNHSPDDWINKDEIKNQKYMDIHKSLNLGEPSKTLVANALYRNKKHCDFRIELPKNIIKNIEILNARSIDNTSNSPYNSLNEPNQCLTGSPPILVENRKKMFRRITIRECARFQSFPDDFIFFGSKTNQYKMIGNAVAPIQAFHLAYSLINPNYSIKQINEEIRNKFELPYV